MSKSFRLGFPPLTNDEYVELLRNIDKLSERDQKALGAQARMYELPAALTETERSLRAQFPRFLDFARVCAANDIQPSSEEQLEGEQLIVEIFNILAAAAGWGVQLEQSGSPRCANDDFASGGINIVEMQEGGYAEAKVLARQRRGQWFAGFFEMLWQQGESPPVHPAAFKAQAQEHWVKRLRRRVGAGRLFGFGDSRDNEDYFKDRLHRDKVEGAAAYWNAALDRQGAEGIVPTRWPHRWSRQGFLAPVKKPHALPSDAHGLIDNRNGALTPFPRSSRSSKPRKVLATAMSKLLYLHKHGLLPPPWLQRLLWRTVRTSAGNNPDTRTVPTYIDEEGIVEINDEDKLKDERSSDADDNGAD